MVGSGFRSDFELCELACRIGDYKGEAIIVDSKELDCIIPDMSLETLNSSN